MAYPFDLLDYAKIVHLMTVPAAIEKYGMEKLNKYRVSAHQTLLRRLDMTREELLDITDNMPAELEPAALAAWLDRQIQARLNGSCVDRMVRREPGDDQYWYAGLYHDAWYLSYDDQSRIVLYRQRPEHRLVMYELTRAFRKKIQQDYQRKRGKSPMDRGRWARAFWELERLAVLAGEGLETAEGRLFIQPLLYSCLAGIGVLEPWMRRAVHSLRADIRRARDFNGQWRGYSLEWMEAAAESTLAVLKQYRRTGKWPNGVTLGVYREFRIVAEPA